MHEEGGGGGGRGGRGGGGNSHSLPSGTHFVKRVVIVLAHLKQAYCIT